MVIRRPAPELVAARKYEIARRYAKRKPKVSKRSRGMAAIRLAELTRWLDDIHGPCTALEPSKRSEQIIRIFAHHFMGVADGPRRLSSWYDRYCPWMEPRDREYLISEAVNCPLKWSADALAWKIQLKDEQRSRLRITTIGAIDCSKEQRAERRNRLKAEREKARRAAKRLATVSSI